MPTHIPCIRHPRRLRASRPRITQTEGRASERAAARSSKSNAPASRSRLSARQIQVRLPVSRMCLESRLPCTAATFETRRRAHCEWVAQHVLFPWKCSGSACVHVHPRKLVARAWDEAQRGSFPLFLAIERIMSLSILTKGANITSRSLMDDRVLRSRHVHDEHPDGQFVGGGHGGAGARPCGREARGGDSASHRACRESDQPSGALQPRA